MRLSEDRFGAMEATKPYKFIGFGAMEGTKPYKFIGFWGLLGSIWGRLEAQRVPNWLKIEPKRH